MRIHPTFANIGLSKIVQVSERARLLAPDFEKKSGRPFIYFQRGEVGYPLAPFILDGLREAIEKGWTKYPKSGGESFFKDAVVNDLAARDITGLKPDNILATMGGQEGLQLLFSYFRGRACAGFTPAWSCMFDNIFPYTETNFIPIPLHAQNGWAIDFAAVERTLPRVDTFYFNSPHNPTGRVFPRADIERLCALCQKYGVLLICDEAYKDLAYTGEHFSPIQDPRWENVAVVNTFSKAFAATGFRIGYTVSRRTDLIESLTRAEYSQTAGIPTPIQFAFSKALSNPGSGASTFNVTAMFQLQPDSLRIVRAEVEERSLTQVKPGQAVEIVPESDQEKAYPGKVVRIAGVMGSRKLRSDDPSERADERVVEVVIDAEQAPVLVGQRVLVKFLKDGAKSTAAADKTAER